MSVEAKVLNPDANEDEPVDVLIPDAAGDEPGLVEAGAEPKDKPDTDPGAGIEDLRSQIEARDREKNQLRSENVRLRQEVEQARTSTLDMQIETATKDLDTLKAERRAALEAGDYEAEADINIKIARATVKLDRLETQKETPVRAEPAQPADPLEQALQQFSPNSQAWLRQHPECLTDPEKYHLMIAGHTSALKLGIQPDSPEYFEHIEERVGINGTAVPSPEPRREARREAPATPPQRTPSYAAPPSRGGSGGGGGGTKIRLTPSQRQAARDSGVTDAEYAIQLQRGVKAGEIPASEIHYTN